VLEQADALEAQAAAAAAAAEAKRFWDVPNVVDTQPSKGGPAGGLAYPDELMLWREQLGITGGAPRLFGLFCWLLLLVMQWCQLEPALHQQQPAQLVLAKGCPQLLCRLPVFMSAHAVPCCGVMQRHAVLCCAVLCCAVLCCAVLCCAVLCCAVLCCAVLCCAVLCLPPADASAAGRRGSSLQVGRAVEEVTRMLRDGEYTKNKGKFVRDAGGWCGLCHISAVQCSAVQCSVMSLCPVRDGESLCR
jgi:hypothetical protein